MESDKFSFHGCDLLVTRLKLSQLLFGGRNPPSLHFKVTYRVAMRLILNNFASAYICRSYLSNATHLVSFQGCRGSILVFDCLCRIGGQSSLILLLIQRQLLVTGIVVYHGQSSLLFEELFGGHRIRYGGRRGMLLCSGYYYSIATFLSFMLLTLLDYFPLTCQSC